MTNMVIKAIIVIIISAGPSVGLMVSVNNNLTSNCTLIVHCESGDNDLQPQLVLGGSEFHWSFHLTLIGTTLFWCNLAVQDKRLLFTAYDGNNAYGRCCLYYFAVKDDGVHKSCDDDNHVEIALFPWDS
ncbi:S-protein homolog 29 [Linum perenne]